MSEPARLGLMRHAQSEYNQKGLIQGHIDSPLTPAGEAAALGWGKGLMGQGWQRLVSSDLSRARRTAELVNQSLGLPHTLDPRLRELHWGEWGGLGVEELQRTHTREVEDQESRGWDFQPPGGENRHQLLARVQAALADIAGANPGGKVLVVCHQGVMVAMLNHILGRGFLPAEGSPVSGCKLYVLKHDGHNASLEYEAAL